MRNIGKRMLVLAGAMLLLAARSHAAEATVSGTPSGEKVGQATCANCHAEVAENFKNTFHGRKTLSAKPLADACEACHGNGGDHANGGGDVSKIRNPKKLGASEVADLCLSCHKQKALMMWKTGAHAANNVSCLNCHSVHDGSGRKSLVAGGTDTCLKCHTKQKADMRLASHHPVPEGKMSCVSCHNPHGGIEGNLKTDSAEETCFKCHSDKAGPFAYEHPPVVDGCENCHKPHGSSNEKLLKQSQPYLCLGCHKWPHVQTRSGTGPAHSLKVFEQRSRCTDCHNQIHGSDRKSGLKD